MTEVTTTNAHAATATGAFPRDCGGGERAPTCAESYPSLGLCLLSLCVLRNFKSSCMYDGVGCKVVPIPTLELENNSEKIWNVQFQSWIWKWTVADRNSGHFFQIPKTIWIFCSVKTAPK